MPIPGARFRVKTTKSGKKVRLAFKDDEVVEAKNMKTGDTHTPDEFAADKKKAKKKGKKKDKKSKKAKRSSGIAEDIFGKEY